jgi:hypothetical protein
VCGDGDGGALELHLKFSCPTDTSSCTQQPIKIIMAANKVVILTGASRGKKKRDMEEGTRIDRKQALALQLHTLCLNNHVAS